MDEEMVTVWMVSGGPAEEQIRAFLEAHGIPTAVRGEALRKTHGFTLDGLGQVEIRVSADRAVEARELLERAERGELSLREDDLAEGGEEPA